MVFELLCVFMVMSLVAVTLWVWSLLLMTRTRQLGSYSGMMEIPEVLLLLSCSFCACANVLMCILLLPLMQASFYECQVEACISLSTKNHMSQCVCSNTVSQLTYFNKWRSITLLCDCVKRLGQTSALSLYTATVEAGNYIHYTFSVIYVSFLHMHLKHLSNVFLLIWTQIQSSKSPETSDFPSSEHQAWLIHVRLLKVCWIK